MSNYPCFSTQHHINNVQGLIFEEKYNLAKNLKEFLEFLRYTSIAIDNCANAEFTKISDRILLNTKHRNTIPIASLASPREIIKV